MFCERTDLDSLPDPIVCAIGAVSGSPGNVASANVTRQSNPIYADRRRIYCRHTKHCYRLQSIATDMSAWCVTNVFRAIGCNRQINTTCSRAGRKTFNRQRCGVSTALAPCRSSLGLMQVTWSHNHNHLI